MKTDIIIKEFKAVAVNADLNQYRVDVVFECCGCKHQYAIGEENEIKLNEFMKSIENNSPNRFIGCPICNKVN